MTAIEMVSDRTTKAPIDAARAQIVQDTAYDNGAMVRISGPNLILSPPLVLTEANASTLLSGIEAGLKAA